MNPDGESKGRGAEDGTENAADPGLGRFKRLKLFFVTRYVKAIDVLSGALKRLRSRAGQPPSDDGESDEKSEARSSNKKAKASHADAAAHEAKPPAPHSAVRSVFLYLLVVIVGIIVGMIFSFALLSNMVINQAKKIEDQRDEISQLERLNAKALEAEARYRNRLAEAESELNQLARKTEREPAPTEAVKPSGATFDKSSSARKTGNCTLEAGNPEQLAKCVEDFNRKSGR